MIQRSYKDLKDDRVFSLDWPHGYVTRDGHKARILCTDLRDRRTIGGGEYPIVAVFDRGDGTESLCTYTMNGRQFSGGLSEKDLCNAPAPKRTIFRHIVITEEDKHTISSHVIAFSPPPKIGDWFEGYRVIATKAVTIEEGENS